MAGLGTVKGGNGKYLSVAGGYIWDRKADENDPNYATQEYSRADGTTGTRQGAQYADLTGNVVGVQFKDHEKYGQSINVTVDADGERYILSISTNNRYSQDMMKCLLKMDLNTELFIKPYDFEGSDGKRAMGISFRQNGEKINLRNDDAPAKDKEWFKTAGKKNIKRFFEDLSDWFVEEVEEKVIPQLAASLPELPQKEEAAEPKAEAPKAKVEESKPEVTPFKMKKALKAYIAEHYDGEELPKDLSKEELVKWYELSLQGEELPFDERGSNEAEMSDDDIENELGKLVD